MTKILTSIAAPSIYAIGFITGLALAIDDCTSVDIPFIITAFTGYAGVFMIHNRIKAAQKFYLNNSKGISLKSYLKILGGQCE